MDVPYEDFNIALRYDEISFQNSNFYVTDEEYQDLLEHVDSESPKAALPPCYRAKCVLPHPEKSLVFQAVPHRATKSDNPQFYSIFESVRNVLEKPVCRFAFHFI